MKDEEKKEHNLRDLIFNIIFWVAFAILFGVWVIDFIRVKTEHKPWFCITNKTHKYKDGTVKECNGLGYKVYEYHRDSIDAKYKFGPFFISMEK